MAKYPIFLEMRSRRVVIVGAGTVAFRKVQALLDAGARVVIVAEHIDPAIELLCQKNKQAEMVKAPIQRNISQVPRSPLPPPTTVS